MARSTYESLLEELRRNDVKSFKEILDTEGLPQDDKWYDYDLLTRALRSNRKRIVNYLLDKRCRVNKPDYLSGIPVNTPLHLVAGKLGWCSIIEKMLKMKARVTDVNCHGNTPLHIAFINHLSDRVINLLLNHYLKETTVDIRNKDGLGFMHIACTRANYDAVKAFFQIGMSDIHSQVSPLSDSIYGGYSPLHFAVENGKHHIVEFLCQYGADVYAQDRNGTTPIHLALEKRDSSMIDILFSYDSRNENYVNAFGASHFMAACAGSDPSVVEEYISIAEEDPSTSLSALLNGRVKDIPHYPNAGYTPLHFACEYGRADTIRGLLCIGAGPQCLSVTTFGLTPHNLAWKQHHWEICYLIEQFYYANEQATLALSSVPVVQQVQPAEAYHLHCAQQVAQVYQHELVRQYQALQVSRA